MPLAIFFKAGQITSCWVLSPDFMLIPTKGLQPKTAGQTSWSVARGRVKSTGRKQEKGGTSTSADLPASSLIPAHSEFQQLKQSPRVTDRHHQTTRVFASEALGVKQDISDGGGLTTAYCSLSNCPQMLVTDRVSRSETLLERLLLPPP